MGFDYNCEHDFEDNNIMKIKEKFIDNKSNNIRQQERDLYLNSLEDIEKVAQINGFHLHSKAKMTRINGDKYQYMITPQQFLVHDDLYPQSCLIALHLVRYL